MNFIELRVEDYIDEVLDDDSNPRETEIQILRKFVKYLDRETEIYSVQDITEAVALDYLRIVRHPNERRLAVSTLNGFFGHLFQSHHTDVKLQLSEQALFSSKKGQSLNASDDLFSDGESDEHQRHRARRDFDM